MEFSTAKDLEMLLGLHRIQTYMCMCLHVCVLLGLHQIETYMCMYVCACLWETK